MREIKIGLWLSFFLFLSKNFYARDWSAKNPFEHKVFIENKGQFDGSDDLPAGSILYGISNLGMEIYFTPGGLTYTSNEYREFLVERPNRERKTRARRIPHFLHMEWEGANSNVQIIAEESVSHYFTYSDLKDKSGRSSLKAAAYKKITYKNLYPNIDVEYFFPEGKEGIKYNLILHPGADPSVIKMKYSGDSLMKKDEQGNIHFTTALGDIVDHAPETFYENGKNISSSFQLTGKTVSFRLSEYNHTQRVIIDPWMTIPTFTNLNRAYEVDYDLQGNVYIYGGRAPYQEIKLNSAGVIQWVFTTNIFMGGPYPYEYGDFCVDGTSGFSYIVEGYNYGGARIIKVNAAGAQAAFYNSSNTAFTEMWRIVFNNCTQQAVIAGGGTQGNHQAAILDPSLTTLTSVNILSTSEAFHDVSLLAIDNSNNCYMATARSCCSSLFDNVTLKCPANTLLPVSFIQPNGHAFNEDPTNTNINYVWQHNSPLLGVDVGFNGIAVNNRNYYTYDGGVVKRWNKNNGALINSGNISSTLYRCGGIAVDDCDNIYVGVGTSIVKYDTNFMVLSTIPVTDSVFDLRLGPGNMLYVCGKAFVSTHTLVPTSCSQISVSSTPASCSSSFGNATATVYGGTAPYTYSWNPSGQTTATATGLAAGTYTVTVTDTPSLCSPGTTFTGTVVVTSSSGFNAAVASSPDVCLQSNGTATVTPSGGSLPYTYSWSPSGGAGSVANGLSAGNYTVMITDAVGCTGTETVTIASAGSAINSLITSSPDICLQSNGTATVTPSGGSSPYTYSWSPSGGAASVANGLSAGTYTVIITDAVGCTDTETVTIASAGGAALSVSSQTNVSCNGGSNGAAGVTATGGSSPYTYNWLPSGGSTSAVSGLTAGTYTVTTTDASGCSSLQTVTITQPPAITSSVISTPDTCKSSNGTAIVNVSGGASPYAYLWTNGQTDQTANGLSAGNYSVQITDANGCTSSASAIITVFPAPVAVATPAIICEGQNTTLLASGGGTYTWNTGETTNTIIVSPTSTSTYSVIVSVGNCKDTANTSVTVNPSPIAVAWSDVVITTGTSTTLAASGGGTYIWSNGSTDSLITVSPPVTTIYCVSVFKWGCADSACVKVIVEPVNCTPVNEDAFVLPNAFSPNADGENDRWRLLYTPLLAECIAEFQVVIYNRWGEKIFEGTDITFSWDGTYKGKITDTAVFGYYLNGILKSGTKINKKGNISLLR